MTPGAPYKQCPMCKTACDINAAVCPQCHHGFRTQFATPQAGQTIAFAPQPIPSQPATPHASPASRFGLALEILKWAIVVWTVICLAAMVFGMVGVAKTAGTTSSSGAVAGTMIGTGFGLGFWLVVWAAIGAPMTVIYVLLRNSANNSSQSVAPLAQATKGYIWLGILLLLMLIAIPFVGVVGDSIATSRTTEHLRGWWQDPGSPGSCAFGFAGDNVFQYQCRFSRNLEYTGTWKVVESGTAVTIDRADGDRDYAHVKFDGDYLLLGGKRCLKIKPEGD